MEECSNGVGNTKRKRYCYYNNTNNNNYNDSIEARNVMMIRKGPWKAEEDQVLLNHVQKYGPRDWSSIRSKGLLQRTGKSCRLRWVNKLRPNLKNGCKFTAEEEKVVIELQAQLGNKWARIATHLPGRTDNDVKNFWSSRQKRLARILVSQSPTRSNKKQKTSASSTTTTTTSRDRAHFLEVPKNSLMEGETSSPKAQSLESSSHGSTDTNTMQMIPFPASVEHKCPSFEDNNFTYLEPIALNTYYNSMDWQLQEMIFPSIPPLQTDLSFVPETQELIDRLDSSFFSPFGCTGFGVGGGSVSAGARVKLENDNHATPDSFFDDFPSDVFDDIEPLPSPSRW
ncbi:transcription factor DUO1 [Beta vulgaris subsp. vulgaris]|uniref:transcription factor DUO1 n=1 Tax=Beta vulgaris subsp. vulgaris TaxID=3555 RepID=UPI0025491E67|nr:transcription factor DUO1 [Beta vulgaris subsp. vulgaris]